jgi:hypothetical protein
MNPVATRIAAATTKAVRCRLNHPARRPAHRPGAAPTHLHAEAFPSFSLRARSTSRSVQPGCTRPLQPVLVLPRGDKPHEEAEELTGLPVCRVTGPGQSLDV